MIQDARRRETTNEKEHKIAVRDYIILEKLVNIAITKEVSLWYSYTTN